VAGLRNGPVDRRYLSDQDNDNYLQSASYNIQDSLEFNKKLEERKIEPKINGSSVSQSAYASGYSSATTRALEITVASSAPTLYYYCSSHSGMGNSISTP